MTIFIPSPIPSARTAEAKASGAGSMCGRLDAWSLTVSMSKRIAPGICPARYSASGSRFMVGRYQEPSTTTMSGASSRSASHSGVTKGALGMAKLRVAQVLGAGPADRKGQASRRGESRWDDRPTPTLRSPIGGPGRSARERRAGRAGRTAPRGRDRLLGRFQHGAVARNHAESLHVEVENRLLLL